MLDMRQAANRLLLAYREGGVPAIRPHAPPRAGQAGSELSLAEVAVSAGFSDQSPVSQHFKRLVGVTPGQFRTPARIAECLFKS
jgi:AraC-like DNA-binding protein